MEYLNYIGFAITGVIGLVLLLDLYFKKSRPSNAPPVLSGGPPLLGPFMEFAKNPIQLVRRGYKDRGTVFTVQMFGNNLTFLLGPEAHAPFFSASDKQVNQAEVYKFMTPVFGEGVVYDAPPKIFQRQLRFMSGSLRQDELVQYVPKIIKEAEDYFAKWGDEGEIDFLEKMSELIILTASSTLMGPEIREHLFEQVAELYRTLDEGIKPISFFFPYAPIPAHRHRDHARKAMNELFGKVIKQRRASGTRHRDVLQVFMDAEYADGSKPTDHEITGLMIALLFAGQHTSSVTSTWTLLRILHTPNILQRAKEEQDRVMGNDTELTYEKVNQMDLLHACMKEAIRMNPPLIFLMRRVKEPLTVGKHVVPKGDIVVASPPVSMSLPQPDGAFSKPETFNPDRFLSPDGKPEGHDRKFSYIGFGGGLHACMGERFGYLQVKTILSVLLRNFDLEPVGEMPQPDYTAMVVPPKKPTTVRFRRKKTAA